MSENLRPQKICGGRSSDVRILAVADFLMLIALSRMAKVGDRRKSVSVLVFPVVWQFFRDFPRQKSRFLRDNRKTNRSQIHLQFGCSGILLSSPTGAAFMYGMVLAEE